MSKKPEPHLEILFEGREIYPETIPVRTVADAISAINALARRENVDEDESEGKSIRLLEIKRGSARFMCVADEPKEVVQHLRLVGKWLGRNDSIDKLGDSINPLRRLGRVASSLGSPIVIRNPKDGHDIIARIEPQAVEAITGKVLIKGEKELPGDVQRVGGATERKCALRVSFQSRLLYCTVDNEMVLRDLARFLYQSVIVRGTATWIRRNYHIVDFTIREVYQPHQGPITEAIEALRSAGGHHWDDITDPEGFLRSTSGMR